MRVDPTPQALSSKGTAGGLTAATVDGDVIDPGRVFVLLHNTNTSAATVTAQTPVSIDGNLAVDERTLSVPADEIAWFGPFERRYYGQPAGANESGGDDEGRVYIDYGATPSNIMRTVISL